MPGGRNEGSMDGQTDRPDLTQRRTECGCVGGGGGGDMWMCVGVGRVVGEEE